MPVEEFTPETSKTTTTKKRPKGIYDKYPKIWNATAKWKNKQFFFFFQVGVALELIDLNYSKGIWGLVVEKSLRMANNLSG